MNDAPPSQYEIMPLERLTPAQMLSLTELHSQLLPHSPVVLLGPRFMHDFYYKCLAADGLICGAVALVDGNPAGFIVATDDAAGFMAAGIKRHLFQLAKTLALAIVLEPSRLTSVWEAIQIMRNLDSGPTQAGTGELLSFGVLPDFRSRRFIRKSGLRISQDLITAAVGLLEERAVRRIRSVVDQDNTEARMFYLGLGWKPGDPVSGWKQPVVEFIWSSDSEDSG